LTITFTSEVLKETRSLNIRLPWDYGHNLDKRYPLVIKLDGDSRLDRHDHTLNILHKVAGTSEAIVVAIPNRLRMRNRDLTPTGWVLDADTNSGVGEGDRFLEFIETELLPFLEAKFRTNKTKIFVGYSRGGLLVVHSMIQQPGLFDTYIALSPAFWRDDNKIETDLNYYLKSSYALPVRLYMALGENENEKMKSGFNKVTDVLQNSPANIIWKADIILNGDHQSTPLHALPIAYAWSLGYDTLSIKN